MPSIISLRNSFRIYYNQADPNGRGDLALVSWYDDKNLGLSKEPVLPLASDVYSNFNGRILRVPVFHVSLQPLQLFRRISEIRENLKFTFTDTTMVLDQLR